MRKRLLPLLVLFVSWSSYTHAMDFKLCGWSTASNNVRYAYMLCLSGEVRAGDTDRFLALIRSDPVNVYMATRNVFLDSPGGDVRETISLAKVLGSIYPYVKVEHSCVSSCLLLFLSGATRGVLGGGRVGIHRPTFDFAHLQQLPVAEAKLAYAAAEKEFHDYAISNGLPQSLYERLVATPSTTVYWLSAEDRVLIGASPPYLQEKILASCSSQLYDDTEGSATRYYSCLDRIVADDRLRSIMSLAVPKEESVWEGAKKAMDEALKKREAEGP